jgi:DNA-binding PadR family transcriptional regulator
VLASQLTHALQELPSEGEKYQGYLAQIVRSCFLAIQDGDLGSPQASLDLLVPALHLGERLVASKEATEAAAWIRATSRFFEVAKEALAPRFTVETFLARDRSDTEREVLRILLSAERTPLRRGEIIERWGASHEPPTPVRIGQILASLHETGVVVRVKQRAQGGSDVAFYRLSRLGRELCERLYLRNEVPEGLVSRDAFYARLQEASLADTSAPLYLTTFVEPKGPGGGREFHDRLLANVSRLRRPIYWIFAPSAYFTDVFRPGIEAAQVPVRLYERSEAGTLEPTVQVFGDGGYVYPIAQRTALAMSQDVALATWKQHQSTAHALN